MSTYILLPCVLLYLDNKLRHLATEQELCDQLSFFTKLCKMISHARQAPAFFYNHLLFHSDKRIVQFKAPFTAIC